MSLLWVAGALIAVYAFAALAFSWGFRRRMPL